MLAPSYALLEEKARLSLQAVDPSFVKTVTSKNNVAESEFNWKMVSPLPSVAEHRAKVSAGAILRNAGLFASGASSGSGDNAVSSAAVAGGRSGMRVSKEEMEQVKRITCLFLFLPSFFSTPSFHPNRKTLSVALPIL